MEDRKGPFADPGHDNFVNESEITIKVMAMLSKQSRYENIFRLLGKIDVRLILFYSVFCTYGH